MIDSKMTYCLEQKNYYSAIMGLWRGFIYPERRQRISHRVWSKGCYGPQILTYLTELNKISISNSFKIIQFERLYDDEYFQNIMNLVRCYIHSSDKEAIGSDSFGLWMDDCMNDNISYTSGMEFTKYDSTIHRNSKTKVKDGVFIKQKYETDPMELDLLRVSYAACNAVIKSVIDDNYDELGLEKWDWDKWNM